MRRNAADFGINLMTNLQVFNLLVAALRTEKGNVGCQCISRFKRMNCCFDAWENVWCAYSREILLARARHCSAQRARPATHGHLLREALWTCFAQQCSREVRPRAD